MVTESPIQIIEASRKWGSANMGSEDLGLVIKGQRVQGRMRIQPNRSGSAPPSIEGSFAAIENLLFRQNVATDASLSSPNNATGISESEEQLSDPSYIEYYWSHVNLNPRLPPPLISGENRNLFRNARGMGNNRRLTSFDDSYRSSLRLEHSNLSTHKEESDNERLPKQEDLPQAQSPAYSESRSLRHDPNDEVDNHDDYDSTTTTISSSSSVNGRGGNLAINPPVNQNLNRRSENIDSISCVNDASISGIRNQLVALNISNFPNFGSERSQRNPYPIHDARPQILSLPQTYVGMNQFLQNPTNFSSEVQPIAQSSGFTLPHYATDPAYMTSRTHFYPNMMPAGYLPQQFNNFYAYNTSPISPYATGYLPSSPFPTPFSSASPSFTGHSQTPGVNFQHFNNFYGHLGIPFLGADQKLQSVGGVGQFNMNPRIIGTTNPYYFGSPKNTDFLHFPTSPFASPLIPGSLIGVRNSPGRINEGGYGGWKGHNANHGINDPKTYSFLEELKSGKGHKLELSDIYGHVVEFSVDQHGSRFIQQKLEICSNKEKESVFKEVIPHASKLITDVFGNYVIQKFFEYGSANQRRELGNQLEGQILPLSLQMYGCRVIQKALDAIDLEQKTKLVSELGGHVLKCVRDQNGNHVIQKCIETIPTENIKFIISSFRGQVTGLSRHPYGCRVIQRVLEHSTDKLHSQFIVDEILDSVYDLAQDQYGNYVTQYVLEGGKPEERSHIVRKLAGHIVQLSQHKFASNVIEKCLEYGDPAAREIMIEEIIGYGDESDNLLVMVKDQFANYVVQKVLQTCNVQQREVLLARIKEHLNSLKKYTYGKHIVARFEQLYGEELEAAGL